MPEGMKGEMITMLRKVKNKTKRVLAIIISAMMLITMSMPVTFAAESRWTGSGTSDSPYQISSQADLEAINTGLAANNYYANVYFQIADNINLDSNWTGIGSPTIASADTNSPYVSGGTGFAGILDGNGKTITVNRSGSTGSVGGLVNYLMPSGTVKNLTVAGTVSASGTAEPVGAVVAYNSGVIDKVTNTADVSASSCYNVGGVAGFNNGYYNTSGTAASSSAVNGYILNSSNTGEVSGHAKIGGITGENSGVINSCWNTAAISSTYNGRNGIGGIAGRAGNNGTAAEISRIWNCYNRGIVDANEGTWAGGICGFENSLSACANCYNTAAVLASKYMDAITGDIEGITYNCYAQQGVDGTQGFDGAKLLSADDMQTATLVSSLNGSSTSVTFWTIDDDKNGGYPILTGNATTASSDPVPSDAFSIVVFRTPTKLDYTVGDRFSTDGMKIQAHYVGGNSVDITEYTVSNTNPLTTADKTVTVSGTYDSKSFSFDFNINVTPATLPYIYLDGVNGNDSNNGLTSAAAVKTLAHAITLAGSDYNIEIDGTVTLDSGATYNPTMTIKRGESLNGAMFEVKAPNDDYGVAYVTMTSGVIDGNGTGTVFDVTQGRLRLRGGIKVKNTSIAANVSSTGQIEVNYADISASQYSIKLAGASNTFILDNYGLRNVSISGTVYLGTGAYVTASNAIPCDFAVECQTQTEGTVVVKGSDGYTVTQKDADRMTDSDNTYGVMLREMSSTSGTVSELILAKIRYLDGTQSSNGDGTVNSPYNNLASALNNITGNEMVVVQGTTQLPGGTYSSSTVIQRGANLKDSDPMFNVADGANVTLSWKTITGRGRGVTMFVNGGTVTLSGGISLINCNEAIDVGNNGSVDIVQAVIDAASYSIWMGPYSGTLEIGYSPIINISGSIYLSSGKSITVSSTLATITGNIEVTSEVTSSGTIIATCRTHTGAVNSAEKLIINGNAGRVVGSSSKNIVI
jgi:hypothetical protein